MRQGGRWGESTDTPSCSRILLTPLQTFSRGLQRKRPQGSRLSEEPSWPLGTEQEFGLSWLGLFVLGLFVWSFSSIEKVPSRSHHHQPQPRPLCRDPHLLHFGGVFIRKCVLCHQTQEPHSTSLFPDLWVLRQILPRGRKCTGRSGGRSQTPELGW